MSAQRIRRERLKEKLTMALDPESEFVISPCIAVCKMDTVTKLCEGCLRELQEIVCWGSLNTAQKKEVWGQIVQRMNVIKA